MTTQAEVAATNSWIRQMAALSTQLSAILVARWNDFDRFDGEQVDRYIRLITPAAEAATAQSANLSVSLLGALQAPPVGSAPQRPPIPDVELRAPFLQAWSQLNQGAAPDIARESGARRAAKLGTDIVTRASDDAFTAADTDRVVGWRRVPRNDTCRWCLTVSTQRYTSARAASRVRHDGCDCRVVPIVGDTDPGQVINRPLLDRLKDEPDARYLTTA